MRKENIKIAFSAQHENKQPELEYLMKRVWQIVEIANSYVFLASDDSSFTSKWRRNSKWINF